MLESLQLIEFSKSVCVCIASDCVIRGLLNIQIKEKKCHGDASHHQDQLWEAFLVGN